MVEGQSVSPKGRNSRADVHREVSENRGWKSVFYRALLNMDTSVHERCLRLPVMRGFTGKAPWYLYMESGDLMHTYAQLKKTEKFVLRQGSGGRTRKKNKTMDEAQAYALAATANPEQFGCLSEQKVLDAIFAARKMGVCVIVRANHFAVDYSAGCKVTPIINRYQHKYLSFERFLDFVADAQRYANP